MGDRIRQSLCVAKYCACDSKHIEPPQPNREAVPTGTTFDLLLRQVPPVAYGNVTVSLDLRVAVFAVTLGILAGFLFAVLPAWWSARLDVRALVDGTLSGGPRRRGFAPMITAQLALAIVLVFGAMIAGRAFISVLQIPLGFSPDDLIAINARPPRQKHQPE